jgi:predicted PurR-regulated permease PerM
MWPGASPSAVVNAAAGMTIAALLIAALYAGRELLIPLALAGLLSFILAPPVRWLEYWRVPHVLSVLFVIAVLLGVLFAGTTFIGNEVAQLLEDLPRHEANLRDKARFVQSEFGGSGVWQRAAATIRSVEDEVRDPQTEVKPIKVEVAPDSDSPISAILEYTRSSIPSLMTALLALMLTIFILLQYRDLRGRVLRLMGRAEIGRSTQAFDDAGTDLAHFLLLQSAVNASFGLFVGVALWAVGVPSPALWGALAAVMRFVPYVGSLMAAAFPMALAAIVDPGWGMVLKAAAIFLISEPLVGQIVESLLYGSQTRLSTLAVLVGTMFWTLLWGPVGLILAMPLTLMIVVIGRHVPRLEFLRILLGNEPALLPREKLYHQLLAGDASRAAKEAEGWIGEHTFDDYLDEVAIPSLRIASDDQKRDVLSREHMKEIKETIAEYIELLKESLDFKQEGPAMTMRGKPDASRRPATALILAGRGAFDLAASELIAEAIRLDLGMRVRCPSLGGLTGIGAAAEATPDEPPDIIAIISVGAVTPAQLDFLLRRARESFPRSQLIICYWGAQDPQNARPQQAANSEGLCYADSAASLIDLVGRIADEQTQIAETAPPLAEHAGT